jgi:uncharacterized membrane protein
VFIVTLLSILYLGGSIACREYFFKSQPEANWMSFINYITSTIVIGTIIGFASERFNNDLYYTGTSTVMGICIGALAGIIVSIVLHHKDILLLYYIGPITFSISIPCVYHIFTHTH